MKKSGIILLIAAVIMVGCTKLDSRGFNEKTKKHSVTKTMFVKDGFDYAGY